MKLCDLHTHSVFSDGTMTPEQLIDEAVGAGLYATALTDHNVVEGLERFLSYAADKPIEAVPGIEFTTSYKGQELHILGLFLPRESYEAVTEYVRLAHERKEVSNLILASRLNENGYPIDYEKLKAARPDGKVNRAHFAAALVDAGLIESRDEAFRTILSPSYGWYEEYERLDTLTTIRFIRSLGAVPVWAHPLFHVDRQTCEELIPVFKVNGLVSVETIYSTYTEDDTAFLKKLCSKYELLESGGSDFHGANKPDIAIGTGRGNLRIPYSFYERLLERRNRIESYGSLLKRTAYQQENLLLDDGDFAPHKGMLEKVDPDNSFRPFYGDTTVFDLDDDIKKKVAAIQDVLYSQNPECFCARLAPSTIHMTLHDLDASVSQDEVFPAMMQNEAGLRRKCESLPIPAFTIRMRTNFVCDSVQKSLVLNVLPETPGDWAKLALLYEWVDEVRPLPPDRKLYPHITLAYYNHDGFSAESMSKLKKTVLELNQTGFAFTIDTAKLYYQHFTDMNSYENIFKIQ